MKTMFKRIAVFALALGALGVYTLAALAAAPANDTFPNAKPVTIGFSEVLDTTEATTDSDDAQFNVCGFQATDASVWYALEGTNAGVVVDISQSDYSVGLLVGVGTQGNLQVDLCWYGNYAAFFAAAGTTYYVLAFDNQNDGGGNGGLLNISFIEAPPPPTLEITMNSSGSVNARTGVATISGTYTCTNGDFISVYGDAHQKVGRFTIFGFFGFFDSGTCDGAPHNWSAEVFPQNGKFAGGKLTVLAYPYSCGPFECAFEFVEQEVRLRGGRK